MVLYMHGKSFDNINKHFMRMIIIFHRPFFLFLFIFSKWLDLHVFDLKKHAQLLAIDNTLLKKNHVHLV